MTYSPDELEERLEGLMRQVEETHGLRDASQTLLLGRKVRNCLEDFGAFVEGDEMNAAFRQLCSSFDELFTSIRQGSIQESNVIYAFTEKVVQAYPDC